jgi:hypothetical protein
MLAILGARVKRIPKGIATNAPKKSAEKEIKICCQIFEIN